jgi:hypothetical protein
MQNQTKMVIELFILQSAPTHNKDLYSIKIKKGTLIVVDVNTKEY